jgi:hypothetical protein
MPCLKKCLLVLDNQMTNPVHLMLRKTPIFSERNRGKPELGNLAITLDVDVRRFSLVGTEENKTIRAILKDSRHEPLIITHHSLHTRPTQRSSVRCARIYLVLFFVRMAHATVMKITFDRSRGPYEAEEG